MKRSNQKGVALIFALIFVLVLSIAAAALMFLSQSETFASLNYRMMILKILLTPSKTL